MSLEWNKKARGAVAMAMAIHRINRKEIAEQLGTSPSTLRAWIDQPGKMTVDNWTRLCNIVGLDRSTLQMKARTAMESTAKRETR